VLRDLIQMSAHAWHLKLDLALVDLVMAVLTQGKEIRQGILPSLLPIDDVVSFQATVVLPTLLACVPVTQETGHTQILIESGGVLVLRTVERRGIESGDIDLDILNDDG
jgi:hypothetical protein